VTVARPLSPLSRPVWAVLALVVSACANAGAPPAAGPNGAVVAEQRAPSDDAAGRQPAGRATPATSAGAATLSQNKPLPGGEEPTPDKALPELRIEPLGMHVGGGKNSPEEKAPFHRALERQFPAFMACYRLVDEPWAGGSFGIDIKIARAGGAPTVEQPRTRLRGAGFQECMVAAFAKAQFDKPKAGPTVISYSVLFSLGKGKH